MTELTRKNASSNNGGELTDGTQTINGDKTFTGNVSMQEATESTSGLAKKASHLRATLTGGGTGYASLASPTVIFNSLASSSFSGAPYSTGTGIFTVPEAGIYSIKSNVIAVASDLNRMLIRIVVDSTIVAQVGSRYDAVAAEPQEQGDSIGLDFAFIGGENVEIQCFATTDGGTWGLANNVGGCSLSITKIG